MRTWQWARSANRNGGWADISGASSARYTPSDADDGMYLQARVSYEDAHGSSKRAQGVSSNKIPTPDIRVATLVSGLSIPWDLAFTPDGTMLFTQRAGVLSSRLADGTVQTVTADLSDLYAASETGFMAIVVDPNFRSNRRFYTCQGHTGPEVQVIAPGRSTPPTRWPRASPTRWSEAFRPPARTAAAGSASGRRATCGSRRATGEPARSRRT